MFSSQSSACPLSTDGWDIRLSLAWESPEGGEDERELSVKKHRFGRRRSRRCRSGCRGGRRGCGSPTHVLPPLSRGPGDRAELGGGAATRGAPAAGGARGEGGFRRAWIRLLARPRPCVPGHASRAASPGSSVTGAAHRAVQVAKGPGRVHRAWRPAHSRCPGTIVPSQGSHCPFLSLVSPMENKATLGAT